MEPMSIDLKEPAVLFAPAPVEVKTAPYSGTCLWQPHKLDGEEVDEYLKFVKGLFDDDEDLFCEEKALYFLHQSGYNIEEAKKQLIPWQPQQETETEHVAFDADDFCYLCRDGGDIILCDHRGCRKAFHPACIRLESVPNGKWECPFHKCQTCSDKTVDSRAICVTCPTAFCNHHIPKDIRTRSDRLKLLDFMCPACISDIEGQPDPASYVRKSFIRRVMFVLKRHNRHLPALPRIGAHDVDLCALYREVTKQGGIQQVMSKNGWARVRRALNLPASQSNFAPQLKKHYLFILYPYEKTYFPGSVPPPAHDLEEAVAAGLAATSPAKGSASAAAAAKPKPVGRTTLNSSSRTKDG